jgi:hypothetical protein
MTDRDEFAKAALQAILTLPDLARRLEKVAMASTTKKLYVAALAFEYADAMLKARELMETAQ